MSTSILAVQWDQPFIGILLVFILFGLFLVPYLVKEIRTGKADLGPLRRMGAHGEVTLGAPTPPGAGDRDPGRQGDPAPGVPSGQADPYGPRAQRGSSAPIKS